MKKPLFKSLLTHLGVLLGLGLVYSYWVIRAPSSDLTLEVTLEDVHVHHSAPTQIAAPVKAVPETAVLKTSVPDSEISKPDDESTSSALAADSARSDLNDGQRSAYLSELMRIISAQKNYPRAAILNELQGTVKLRVSLGEEGRVTACEVIESSGHEILDQSALATLRKIGRFPLPSPDVRGVVLVIPILYELNPEHDHPNL